MDRVSPIYGRQGIPLELESLLPWWLRYRNSLFVTPLTIVAVIALLQGYTILAAVLLFAALAVLTGAFWVAKAWLTRSGLWTRGTWHAEVLPLIYKLRATLQAVIAVAFWGGYLVLETHARNSVLIITTVSALILIVPIFVWLSIVQGFVGSGFGNIDFRENNPARFWSGLCMYSAGMSVFVAVVIFFVTTN